MRTYLTQWIDTFFERSPWTNVLGLARSVLALGTLLTLLTNSPHTLFPESTTLAAQGISSVTDVSLFRLMSNHLVVARWVAIAGLTVVVSGWRPRFTCLIHWYISFSFFSAATAIDGGDHLASVLSLLLVPYCLADSRRWHWLSPQAVPTNPFPLALAWVFVLLIRCQVSIIYLHAATAKVGVEDWINGTAVYYWSTHHYHGAADWIKPLVLSIMSTNLGVTLVTWGTMVLELILFAALLIPSRDPRRKGLLWLGLSFHFSIVLVHGLISFFCSMAAALILYLRPADSPFHLDHIRLPDFIDRVKHRISVRYRGKRKVEA